MARPPTRGSEKTLRLNRFLAQAGLGSRRGVESLIQAGRVSVDGQVVTECSLRVDPAVCSVSVDHQPVKLPDDHRIYAFHKPLDIVSTLRPQGRQRGLLEYRLQADLPERFKPVGRLDRDSSGLILWTDDGILAQALLRPRNEVWKTYAITLARPLSLRQSRILEKGGLVLDGQPVRPCRVLADPGGDLCRWQLELHEGRKRQIRRMLAALDNRVVQLVRLAIGPVRLGRLRAGHFRRLSAREVMALRRAAGLEYERERAT